MSSTVLLVLCFASFLMGQMFHAFCAGISHHIAVKTAESVTIASDAGYSFKTVVGIVVSVLIIHNFIVLLVIRRLLAEPKAPSKTRRPVLKALLWAADGASILLKSVGRLALILLRGTCIIILVAACIARRSMAMSIPWSPRLTPHQSTPTSLSIFGGLRAVLRAEYSTALGAVALPFLPGCIYLQDPSSHGLEDDDASTDELIDFLFLLLLLLDACELNIDDEPCYAIIEELSDSFDEDFSSPEAPQITAYWPASFCSATIQVVPDATSYFVDATSLVKAHRIEVLSFKSYEVFYPSLSPSYLPPARGRLDLQVAPMRVRAFHLHLLRHHFLAAAVTSRTSRLGISYSTTDEVHDTAHTRVVETVSESSSIEEMIEEAAVEESASTEGFEDTASTLVFEAAEEKIIESVIIDKLQESTPVYEELDWDRAPSYEEFASGAPPEPLFEQRRVSLAHVIHRPPSLEVLAARIGAKPIAAVRASRLPMLARLSSRANGDTSVALAESAAA
ncbi:hypothetical protein FB451DRAFT_1410051 [Mycena latifolia]|nr:hypothetical protein FB451DRAFT_1410051 [Mycena latifolia]